MIVAKNGRYGPYVSHNGINANLPNEKTPETITLDEAVGLIDARVESGGGSSARRKRPARGAPAKKAAASKPAAPKADAAKPKKRAAASAAKAPRKSKKPIQAAE
jgi:DNA topoisomerase-1